MELSEKELDELIKKGISTQLVNEINVPDINDQWNKIKYQIIQEQKSKGGIFHKLVRQRITWIAAVLLLASSFTFSNPGKANALSDKIIEFFSYIVGKTTVNQTESYKDSSEPQLSEVENVGTNIETELTLEDAKKAVAYKVVQPQYLPKESSLKRIVLINLGSDINQVKMEYETAYGILFFSQVNVEKGSSKGSLYDTDDTAMKEIAINNNPASIYTSKNGFTTVNWQSKGLMLQLMGKMPEEEIIKLANFIE